MFGYISLCSAAILVPKNAFIMLVIILLFQHFLAKFVTYYSQNYASIIGSGLAGYIGFVSNLVKWLASCMLFGYNYLVASDHGAKVNELAIAT